MIYIYKHRNKINDKVYVGQTNNIEKRWYPSSYKDSPRFYNAIQKYGWDNFTHEILSEIEDQNEADNQEIALIEYFDSTNREKGYNIVPGGGLNVRGMKFQMTEEHRKNISNGRKGITFSDEHKKNLSNSHKGKYNGSKNPSAKGVYLIDTIEGWDEYYPSVKDLHNNYPEWNYKSLLARARCGGLFRKQYKIEYE